MSEQLKAVRSFDDKVSLMERRIAAIGDHEKKHEVRLKSLQVAAGEALLEVRGAVEAGEIGELCDWWSWFEDNVRSISRRTAERYMQFAGAAEPEATVISFKAKEAERQRAAYQPRPKVPVASEKAHSTTQAELSQAVHVYAQPKKRYASAPDDDELVAQAWAIWNRMSWNAKVKFQNDIRSQMNRWHRGED